VLSQTLPAVKLKSAVLLKKLVRELVHTAIGVFLLAIGARVKFIAPFTLVPFTLQTMFLHYLLFIHGKRAWRYVAAYVLLGLAGIPVFAYGGGVLYVFSPTFGYLVGFVLGTLVAGLITPLGALSLKRGLTAGFTQLAIIYTMGATWLAVWYVLIRGFSFTNGLILAVVTGVLPFIAWDTLKLLTALALSRVTIAAYIRIYQKIKKYATSH